MTDPAEKDRASEIKQQCVAFHLHHPEVWAEFKRVAFVLINRGHKHYSADGVMHVVRFATSAGVAGADGKGEPFKINNNFVALYARRFVRLHPEHADFFQQRSRTSVGKPPMAATRGNQ